IAINPELPDYYKMRAGAYEKLGQPSKAKEDNGKAASLSARLAAKQAAHQPAVKKDEKSSPSQKTESKASGTGSVKDTDVDKFNAHLGRLESKVFGRQYSEDLIPDRLARLEEKLLSKAQTGAYKKRLDALILKSGE